MLVDIPAGKTAIAEGELAKGITPRGKAGPDAPGGMRQGVNDYTGWFAGDEDMKGTYLRLRRPLPALERQHRPPLPFTLYALDVERCPAEGELRGPDVREGHRRARARRGVDHGHLRDQPGGREPRLITLLEEAVAAGG